MEAEGSLQQSQNPATCPYPEPVQSSPYPRTDFFKIRFNITLPFTRRSSMWYRFPRFSHQNPVCTASLPYVLHAPLISFASFFNPGNILRKGKIMNSLLCSFLLAPVIPFLLGTDMLLTTLVKSTLSLMLLLQCERRSFQPIKIKRKKQNGSCVHSVVCLTTGT